MAVDERDRLNLYDRLGETLGPDAAGTLMEPLPPNGWDDIATKGLVSANATSLRGEMAEVRGEMAGLRGEMAELRSEVSSAITDLRSDLTNEIAQMTHTLMLILFGFMLSIWLTLMLA
jgi:hypothetical protein